MKKKLLSQSRKEIKGWTGQVSVLQFLKAPRPVLESLSSQETGVRLFKDNIEKQRGVLMLTNDIKIDTLNGDKINIPKGKRFYVSLAIYE